MPYELLNERVWARSLRVSIGGRDNVDPCEDPCVDRGEDVGEATSGAHEVEGVRGGSEGGNRSPAVGEPTEEVPCVACGCVLFSMLNQLPN